MKLKNVREFKEMISHFNFENAFRNVRYEIIEVHKYASCSWSADLKIDGMMYSLDLDKLVRWCIYSDVSFKIYHYSDFTCLHFQ